MGDGKDGGAESYSGLIGHVYVDRSDTRVAVIGVQNRWPIEGSGPMAILHDEEGKTTAWPVERLDRYLLLDVTTDPYGGWTPAEAMVEWAYSQGRVFARETLVEGTFVVEAVARETFHELVAEGNASINGRSYGELQRVFAVLAVDTDVLTDACIGGFVDRALSDEAYRRRPNVR